MNEFQKRANYVAFRDYLADCVDAWHKARPVTDLQLLEVLEEIRYKVTEAMIKERMK